jgi:hypothetical protein
MTLITGPAATFEVEMLGETPAEGFAVHGPFGTRYVGPGEPFGAFQLTCFGLAVRQVLGA